MISSDCFILVCINTWLLDHDRHPAKLDDISTSYDRPTFQNFTWTTNSFAFVEVSQRVARSNYHKALLAQFFKLLWNMIVLTFHLLCKIMLEVGILIKIIAIRVLNDREWAHWDLVVTWFWWFDWGHGIFALSCDVASPLYFKLAMFIIIICASSIIFFVVCIILLLYHFSAVGVNPDILKIKNAPLAVFFVLSIDLHLYILVGVCTLLIDRHRFQVLLVSLVLELEYVIFLNDRSNFACWLLCD